MRYSLWQGCRAYLTEWHDKEGKAITVGRCNIGAVSLNLPLIWQVAKNENKNFFNVLSDCLLYTSDAADE